MSTRSSETPLKLPVWVERLRDHQVQAVQEIMAAYASGAGLVVLDAPTGSGKTLIAEVVRQMLGVETCAYVCSSLTLQDQFARDFEEAKVAKGRDNYKVARGRTAADCDGEACDLCVPVSECPYQLARKAAQDAALACVNSTYWLYAANYEPGKWYRDLVVVDECDVFADEVAKFNEVRIPKKWMWEKAPKKGAHARTIRVWLKKWKQMAGRVMGGLEEKEKRSLGGVVRTVARVLDDEWVRSYEGTGLVLKPLWMGEKGEKLVWRHGERWLLMSGSVVDAEGLVEELGYEGEWARVSVDMTFPEENRLVYALPEMAVDMSYRNRHTAWDEMSAQIEKVLAWHPGENVLVHTVSYPLGRHLYEKCGAERKWFYDNSRDRAGVLEAFKREGGVLFAPSMDRGVDFPGDECTVVVVAKIPYPNLKDPVVSGKLNSGMRGKVWYSTQAVRGLLQMTGRHVRSVEDVGVTYVLDSNFKRLFRDRAKFPKWWRSAVRFKRVRAR